MAVYTDVKAHHASEFLRAYDLGPLVALKGITEGVENSNFLLEAEAGRFILTVYERRVDPNDLPFFLGLMDHLAGQGVRCPVPVHARDGAALRELCGKPAAMVSFLPGRWPRRVTPERCRALGRTLADLHLAGLGYTERARPNALSLASWRPLYRDCLASGPVPPALQDELERNLKDLEAAWPEGLPAGVIHADLFPDNVFFEGDDVTGVIDFYFACNDTLAYDLAVCLNAWAFEHAGEFNVTKAAALIEGYREVRPLGPEELEALPTLSKGAALRFLLTRLYDQINQVEGAVVKVKDPFEYLRKLRFHASAKDVSAYGV